MLHHEEEISQASLIIVSINTANQNALDIYTYHKRTPSERDPPPSVPLGNGVCSFVASLSSAITSSERETSMQFAKRMK